jgi:hypothetical protein
MFFESAAYLYEAHGIFVSHSTELLENGGLPLLAQFQSRLTTNLQADEKRLLFSDYSLGKRRPPLCHLDRSAA